MTRTVTAVPSSSNKDHIYNIKPSCYYRPPVTCYLLPVTCYLLPVTCYLLLVEKLLSGMPHCSVCGRLYLHQRSFSVPSNLAITNVSLMFQIAIIIVCHKAVVPSVVTQPPVTLVWTMLIDNY